LERRRADEAGKYAECYSENRRKKIEREENFVPVLFNKDTNVKLPTTRTKEFQIQSFKSRITYGKKDHKDRPKMEGWRIFHVIRKEFKVEIIKNGTLAEFLAPFNFINLDLTVSLEHMKAIPFEKDNYPKGFKTTRKIGFNILRIEEPFTQSNLRMEEKVTKLLPMIAYSSEESFGKYDVVETALEAYSHDERELVDLLNEKVDKQLLFRDYEPTQLDFKAFKYAIFKIPLFRYPVVDMMTIFVPLWLLSFISIYVFYQTTEIMNRIVNVAALMIAYAAIQPIVRENLPDATTLTLVDVLIYMELLINILFLVRTIDVRALYDTPDITDAEQVRLSNNSYNRWNDGLFIASVAISITNFLIVVVLILYYLVKKQNYKAESHIPRRVFMISDEENWTLKLLMERSFARYRQTLEFED
jgi:hypothetical protein